MDGYIWCHYCEVERKPETLDYSGYCVFCGTKATVYAANDGPLAPGPALDVDDDVIESLTMDGEAVPLDGKRKINWKRKLTLSQLIGDSDGSETCGTCLYGSQVTDQIVSCPISHGKGAARHMDIHTQACRAYVPKVTQ